LRDVTKQSIQFSVKGKGKGKSAGMMFLKDNKLRQYEAGLENVKNLFLLAHQYYSL
jgi:hypothetical protein